MQSTWLCPLPCLQLQQIIYYLLTIIAIASLSITNCKDTPASCLHCLCIINHAKCYGSSLHWLYPSYKLLINNRLTVNLLEQLYWLIAWYTQLWHCLTEIGTLAHSLGCHSSIGTVSGWPNPNAVKLFGQGKPSLKTKDS